MPFILKKPFAAKVIAMLLVGLASSAHAQQNGTEGGVSLHYGIGNNYQRLTLNYETPSWWTVPLGESFGRMDLTGEFGVSYWKAEGSRSPSDVWQFNAIPMFRWWAGERFYLEAGIGATAFTGTRFAGHTLSIAYQFGDHVGLGFLLAPNQRLGVRYSHF